MKSLSLLTANQDTTNALWRPELLHRHEGNQRRGECQPDWSERMPTREPDIHIPVESLLLELCRAIKAGLHTRVPGP